MKALDLPRSGDRLLAFEIYHDDGRLKGVRPLGGSIAFGETAQAAVVREFKEELGLDVDVLGGPIVMENLYGHEGSVGHEVLFVFDIALPPGALVDQKSIAFHEDDGTPCIARWYDLAELDSENGPPLFPTVSRRS